MSEDFIIDGVAHAHNFRPDNFVPGSDPDALINLMYDLQVRSAPEGDQRWVMSSQRFRERTDATFLAHALFAESEVDACIYHSLPIYSLLKDGSSHIDVGLEMRRRWPGRVALYGAISPFRHGVLDRIDRLVDESGVVGLKLYPQDLVDGRIRGYRLDERELTYPIFEHACKRGIKTVAMHKAVPFGPIGIADFRVNDVAETAAAFPNLNFEIFHGGFAFLEETLLQMLYTPNVTVNLEGVISYITFAPRKFASILGEFLSIGAWNRLVWGTGCMAAHPQPLLKAFREFEMPADLMAQYGYPQLTAEMKRSMLGLTQARICGIDIASMKQQSANDEFARIRAEGLREPWSCVTR